MLIILCVILTITSKTYGVYKVPQPEILVYDPQGLSVSIPHSPGMRLFAFHANFNKRITLGASGEYYKQVVHQTDGKWSFTDDEISVKVGDTIYYWITVVKDRVSHRLVANFTVNEIVPLDGKIEKEDCMFNLTQLESEIEVLLKKNLMLTHLLEKTPNVNTLTMSGRLPPDGLAISTVTFIINEKLDINPTILSAVRNADDPTPYSTCTSDDIRDPASLAIQSTVEIRTAEVANDVNTVDSGHKAATDHLYN
ncbi:hypothetical protein RN001_003197 [Aquatica leii]|uniref:CBM39 domain-containing protein n=1 Tax=Aquatica leii TaxID=1421715 RepID=A0AAN7PQT8_9COLE|nr:hypothetical protein RN001_003197 [Aquatica leii]